MRQTDTGATLCRFKRLYGGMGEMIAKGSTAPDFALSDHLGRKVELSDFKGKQHLLLLFYPLDWTPT